MSLQNPNILERIKRIEERLDMIEKRLLRIEQRIGHIPPSPPPPPEPFKLDLQYLLVGYFGVSYCFTTPVILTLMALYYPDINKPVMRLTAFLGLLFGLYNIVPPLVSLALGTYLPEAIWRGTILHLPLLITSLYALTLTIKTPYKQNNASP